MYQGDESTLFPITITSQGSESVRALNITETFTTKYLQHPTISAQMAHELREVFRQMDGKLGKAVIERTDAGICVFCECLIAHQTNFNSLADLTSLDIQAFVQFYEERYPTNWYVGLTSLRPRIINKMTAEWPSTPPRNSLISEGMSVAATGQMREALKTEIDRIRQKQGRLKADLDKGKVIEIDLSQKPIFDKDIPGFEDLTRADFIRTVRKHLPKFPRGGFTHHVHGKDNVGVWLLQKLQGTPKGPVEKKFQGFFPSVYEMVEYYFPTTYDAACVLMHIGIATGWNKEVVKSVGSDQLNLRFKANRLLKGVSKNHAVIQGFKFRSQPKDKPKPYTHLSDLTDNYGLFNVLRDYYELTKTFRFGDDPAKEGKCIFLAFANCSSKGAIVSFGPGMLSSSFAKLGEGVTVKRKGKTQYVSSEAQNFFSNHDIYDDGDKENPQVKIETTSWASMRTSYETVLEDMGLPLYVRQMLLGHESIDTSMFPYGSDVHATKVQMGKLAKLIHDVHGDFSGARYFQGALLSSKNDPRRRKKEKVVSIGYTDWHDNVFMLCENPRHPSWPGNELYIKSGENCTYVAKCLFCKQCLLGAESLPYLAQWDMDIEEYFEEEGDWDSDLKWLELRQAIREFFEIWERANGTEAIELARAKAERSDFERIPLDIWHVAKND